ncbi:MULTISPECIES: WecB/TagA/CpsF family glycosyltransferase [unclassified Pseudomonas]|uniref:WecB/TagA/CpsF family glycosyltransferase n=1 Tax=unclassified Pseudomonas TaxID=196821 RepID=UPI002AC953DF|nr:MULTISPECIES: WecB/TagA/CpsF family glycosyltransferase [unclassified Pseudomonas]MEB0039866.1 WecB/TagA/CpsF family glycosyltransferase [Pseudomonas sp. MH10]MEB0077192.1 WecB/TagA/CpsF family glycosyltransferase [Pseudomonas sp. MH10out]MEB0091477.1 WecB/TagA/CpsF family glycosyltransferase [Pseudomonas sp. CCI4.2]MEB0101539.1 WecB/TagA/CpsF family glycosyltransferase [Pseudomonas sp. CCI3.2]MEB0120650.1 WecB/TagA/CpsF family glycosyltransferase [Pseudomonas sp. CCI1.2]
MNVFGIEFYHGQRQQLIEELIILSRAPFSYMVTANVNHIVLLDHDERFRDAYQHARHRICDSRVLFPLLRRFKAEVAEPIPGSTLTRSMMSIAQDRRWTVTVLGCEDDVIATLKIKYPSITFYHFNPPMGFIDDPLEVERCVAFIRHHEAHMTVLSVGSPRQEIVAAEVLARGGAMGFGLCVGASLTFLSGKVKRAPNWVQRLSLEWLHRMCTEPKRLAGRYAVDAYRILPIIARQLRKHHWDR